MAEALAAVGLASAIIQFIDFGTKIVKRLSDFSAEVEDVPETFRLIKVQLPLILDTLQQTKDQADARQIYEETAKALKAVVDECIATVQQLDEILTKALPNGRDSTWQKYRKALSSLAQDKKISQLQASIERHIPILTYYQTLVISRSSKDLPFRPTARTLDTNSPQRNQKPCFMVRFEQDPNFVGRESELREIEERFKEQHRVVLSGIGGVGKSQIAIEYCYRFRRKHKDAHVFWIHGSSYTRFEESYQQIAERLALPGLDDPSQQTLVHVRDWLSEEANCPWLLVLDNIDDVDIVFRPTSHSCSGSTKHTHEPLVNWLPRSSIGSMLVTTRDRRLGERLVPGQRPIAVNPFEMKDAKCLLSKRVQLEDDVDEALSHQLLETLDFLPLAITQATAFLAENEYSIAEYLEILQKDDSEMKEFLATDIYDPGRDSDLSNSILQTWKVSFDQIRTQTPLAAEILSLMAVLDRQAISDRLLCRGKKIGIDFLRAIGVLKAFSMIKAESGNKVFSTHRLVQLATQKWLELEGAIDRWQEIALESVCCCIPQTVLHKDWREWETISPHVARVLENDTGKTTIRTQDHLTERAWLLLKHGDYVHVQQGSEAALPYYLESLELRQQFFATDSLPVLWSKIRVAETKQANVAVEMFRDILKKCESKAGVAGYDVLEEICLSTLAEIILRGEEGDYKEVEKLYKKLCKKCPPYIGSGFLYFVYGSYLLEAIWKQGCHRKDEAEKLHEQMMSELTDSHWKEIVFILRGLTAHADYLQGTGRYDEAEKLCERMLEALKLTVGEDHEHYKYILRCYENNCLGHCLKPDQRSRHYKLLARITSGPTCVDPMAEVCGRIRPPSPGKRIPHA